MAEVQFKKVVSYFDPGVLKRTGTRYVHVASLNSYLYHLATDPMKQKVINKLMY